MFADCWQVCSVSCHGSIMFDKVQNIEVAKPNPQSCSTGIVVRCFACLRVESSEHGAGALWENLTSHVWEVVNARCSSCAARFVLLPSVEGIPRHLSCGSWFQPWLLAVGQQFAIYSFIHFSVSIFLPFPLPFPPEQGVSATNLNLVYGLKWCFSSLGTKLSPLSTLSRFFIS